MSILNKLKSGDWEVVETQALPRAMLDQIRSDCENRGTQHTQTTFNGHGTFRRNKTTGVILGEYTVTERSMGDSDTDTLYIKYNPESGECSISASSADLKNAMS